MLNIINIKKKNKNIVNIFILKYVYIINRYIEILKSSFFLNNVKII